ncbi:MAG: hypothetical protein ACI89T_002484 [Cognaticolwellia sp.]|jgi:hypothetical protein
MTKLNKKVEDLLAKHPNLSQAEVIKIVTDKNERKKKKRSEKTDRGNAKKLRSEAAVPNTNEDKGEDDSMGDDEDQSEG